MGLMDRNFPWSHECMENIHKTQEAIISLKKKIVRETNIENSCQKTYQYCFSDSRDFQAGSQKISGYFSHMDHGARHIFMLK